jgi:iron complex transport system substrate-binding protein
MTRLGGMMLLLGLAACAVPPAPPHHAGAPRVASMNPCIDAILVRVADPKQILSISHYSQDPAATSIPLEVARRYSANAETAEEMIALRPDLVLASSFTPAATRRTFARAGLKTLYLDSPVTIAASEVQVRMVAAAVGRPGRGDMLVAEIEAAASKAARIMPRGQQPSALLFIGSDLVNGGGTLLDELMRRAGFRNAAADYGLRFTGTLPGEFLVARPPAVILSPGRGGRIETMRQSLLPRTRQALFPRTLVNCGGPSIPPALERLTAIRASLS